MVAAFGINRLSRGEVWTPWAFLFLISFPGFSGSLNLGQNSAISVTLMIWGWVALTRQRPIVAGILWAFLSFKPVWPVVLCLVPLLSRRWKMLFAMITTGLGLILLTLPFVGVQTWWEWIQVGRAASKIYDVDYVWIQLSRDFHGLVRRWWIDFEVSYYKRNEQWVFPTVVAWSAWGLVLIVTVVRSVLKSRTSHPDHGPGASFLILGSIFVCYHFMYYDLMLAALPVALLLLRPLEYLQPMLVGTKSSGQGLQPYEARLPTKYPLTPEHPRPRWVWSRVVITLAIAIAVMHQWEWVLWHWRGGRKKLALMIPWDQMGLLLVWGWCGWQWRSSSSTSDEGSQGESAK